MDGDLISKKDGLYKANTEAAKARDDLAKSRKDYESLKQKHDQEVKELFENKDTLRFVQQMKHYKDQWQSNDDDDSRKKIAT